ncbi:hypothetical protein F4778DRAFT_744250, partial [Xylariomycetidae sp. FL2044]
MLHAAFGLETPTSLLLLLSVANKPNQPTPDCASVPLCLCLCPCVPRRRPRAFATRYLAMASSSSGIRNERGTGAETGGSTPLHYKWSHVSLSL